MKILYLTEQISVLGGVERTIQQKANYFIENFGYKVGIYSETYDKNMFFKLNEKVKIYSNNKSLWGGGRKIEKIKEILYLKKIIKEEGYNIIITTGTFFDYYLPLFFRKEKIIKEFHLAQKYTGLTSEHLSEKKLYKINKSLSKYDKIVILTEEDKKNWDLKNIEVIPNAITFYPEKTTNFSNPKIISVGRLEKQKGYDILIEIWRSVSKYFPNWTLEVYGEGKERENLEKMIKEFGIEDSFILKGSNKNIGEKYKEASIYVMSSRYEGMPMVLLEAMSYGLPIVSFECPTGPKDIIKDGEDGFLVEIGNKEKFENKLMELMKNEELRRKMGENARKNIIRFSQDNVMNQWKKLFEKLKGNE